MTQVQRPLLMRGPLVRATLDGRKDVTRRLDLRWLKAKPGDLIWVKETWRSCLGLDNLTPTAIGEKAVDAGYRLPWAPIEYVADGYRDNWLRHFDGDGEPKPGKTRVSIHLPKWASRLWLEVVSVREENVQDITEEDAKREGVEKCDTGWLACGVDYGTAREAFRYLWQSIHGETSDGAWAYNPVVARIEFKRAERPRINT